MVGADCIGEKEQMMKLQTSVSEGVFWRGREFAFYFR